MKTQPIAPTGIAQRFGIDETFFSMTDSRSIITAGNQVFSRTSGYELGELIGQAHNIIRHPDMPRCVFRMLWKRGKAGMPFMGYVKNHAKNGNHYWVFAVIEPTPSGYLSIRIKPSSETLVMVEALYRKLLAIEEAALAAGRSADEAMRASETALEAALNDLGFGEYEAFSHQCIALEIGCRDRALKEQGLRLFPASLQTGANCAASFEIAREYENTLEIYERLGLVLASLEAFKAIGNDMKVCQGTVRYIAEDFRLHALNANVASTTLGHQGIAIGTITQFLHSHATKLSSTVGMFSGHASQTNNAVAEIASRFASARLQLEMLLSFMSEMASDAGRLGDLVGLARDLRAAFRQSLALAHKASVALQASTPCLLRNKEEIRKLIVYFKVAQIAGVTESVRVAEAEHLRSMFDSLKGRIDSAQEELAHLDSIIGQLTTLATATPARIENLAESFA